MGPWKYQSRHSCVCHSIKHISLYQCVIYWFCIVGEWFHIVEHFWWFSLCNVVILPSVEFWVQLWHICVGLILVCLQAPIGFVWLDSNSSPFLVVGVVSQVWRAVLLCSFWVYNLETLQTSTRTSTPCSVTTCGVRYGVWQKRLFTRQARLPHGRVKPNFPP